MALTLVPLAASLILIFVPLDGGIIDAFQDTAKRSLGQVHPTQQLRLALWEAAVPLNEYIATHEPRELANYNATRAQIDQSFARLRQALDTEKSLIGPFERARTDWIAAQQIGEQLLAAPAGAPEAGTLADAFDDRVLEASNSLGAVYTSVNASLIREHAAAERSYHRAQRLACLALGASLVLMLVGTIGVGRVIIVNVERIVDGARRFANGEREHRIDVNVPPELRRVADEFNTMIRRIQASEADLEQEARRDPLTDIGNRRAFDEALANAFSRQSRFQESFVVLMLDLDHFKVVNDTHGHAAGDEVLRAAARIMASSIRAVDEAFRVGGEEFALLLVNTDVAGAGLVAERIRASIAGHVTTADGAQITVTTSIGIAVAHSSSQPVDLLKAADEALYTAKTTGRNRVVVAAAGKAA